LRTRIHETGVPYRCGWQRGWFSVGASEPVTGFDRRPFEHPFGGKGFAVNTSLIAADAYKQRSISGKDWEKNRDAETASRTARILQR